MQLCRAMSWRLQRSSMHVHSRMRIARLPSTPAAFSCGASSHGNGGRSSVPSAAPSCASCSSSSPECAASTPPCRTRACARRALTRRLRRRSLDDQARRSTSKAYKQGAPSLLSPRCAAADAFGRGLRCAQRSFPRTRAPPPLQRVFPGCDLASGAASRGRASCRGAG